MKPTLVILAAGMASRYGSMKQTDGFGPNGETIIEYSIYDAIKAGFGKVIFVIKEEFAENFKGIFEPKLNGKIETDYVFQTFDLKPFGIDIEIERAKQEFKAITVLVRNPNVPEIKSNMADANVEEYQYDYVIENNGTLEDLRNKVAEFVRKLEEN